MTKSTSIFERVTTLLLSGKVICPIKYEDEYNWLGYGNGINIDDVNQFLQRLNRTTRSTNEKDGYFCAYLDQTVDSASTDIRKFFSEAINDLAPLVHWLSLVQSVTGSDRPLRSGDQLSESELLSAIESVPDYEARLMKVTDTGAFKAQANESKRRLSTLLSKLVEKDYLIKFGSTGSLYKATAKWSMLYDMLDFISSHEGIDEPPQPEAEQIGMFS
jgi:hypothetical protein